VLVVEFLGAAGADGQDLVDGFFRAVTSDLHDGGSHDSSCGILNIGIDLRDGRLRPQTRGESCKSDEWR
jgi:hypothetical protein